jgi:DNA-binding transcriptional LysR family regulator
VSLGVLGHLHHCTASSIAAIEELVRVLPGFEARGAGLYVLYPSAAHVPARVTAFRDFVAAAYAASQRGRG